MTISGRMAKTAYSAGKRIPRGQNPDGRTKKAYGHQPTAAKWKCSTCINKLRVELLKEEKGRGHASAAEVLEFSFFSKAALERHINSSHPDYVPTGERKTQNRLSRERTIRAGLGL